VTSAPPPTDPETEACWHEFLTQGDSRERTFRRGQAQPAEVVRLTVP
jgi:hypothetical protein